MKLLNFFFGMQIFFAVQLLISTPQVFAADQETEVQAKSIFLNVTGHNGNFIVLPSLHGAMAIPFPKYFAFTLADKIGASKGLCLEADAIAAKKDIQSGAYAQKMLVNDEFPVSRYVHDDAQLNIFSRELKLPSEITAKYFARATPFALQQDVLATTFRTDKMGSSLDAYFIEVANLTHIPLHYLETSAEGADQVINTFSDINAWRQSLEKLSQFIECDACKKSSMQHEIEMEQALYLRGDFSQVKVHWDALMALSGSDMPLGRVIGEPRSIYLTEKIVRRFEQNDCNVFAIGAIHFSGQHSVQNELRKRGYDIELVNVTGTYPGN